MEKETKLVKRVFGLKLFEGNKRRCFRLVVRKYEASFAWKRTQYFVTMVPTGQFPRESCKKGKFCLGTFIYSRILPLTRPTPAQKTFLPKFAAESTENGAKILEEYKTMQK